MQKIKLVSTIVALSCWVALDARAQIPGGTSIGDWKITDGGGDAKSPGCMAGRMSQNRHGFWLTLDRDGSYGIMLAQSGGFGKLSEASISVRVNGVTIAKGQLRPVRGDIAEIVPRIAPAMLQYIQGAGVLDVSAPNSWVSIDVSGVSRAIAALRRCVSSLPARTNSVVSEPDRAPGGRSVETKQAPPANSSGTGFIVNGTGEILTNAHVVQGCSRIEVQGDRKEATRTEIVALHETLDLAVLKGVAPHEQPPKIQTLLKVGEPIAVFGFPLSKLLPSSGNFTLGHVSALAGLRDDTRMFQFSAPVQPGNSGGPILDYKGDVVGVATSKLNSIAVAAATSDIPQNVNFGINGKSIFAYLTVNRVEFDFSRKAPEEAALSTTALAEVARKITVFIRCSRQG
jgi:S1-C subfamily serine protease